MELEIERLEELESELTAALKAVKITLRDRREELFSATHPHWSQELLAEC